MKTIKTLVKKVFSYTFFAFKNNKLKALFIDKNGIVDFRMSNDFSEINEVLFLEKDKTYPIILNEFYYIENNSKNTFLKNIDQLFRENYKWSNLLFSNLKFLIVYSENNIIPFTIRSTNPFVKIIYIASSYKDIEFINQNFESIDFLLYNKSLIKKELLHNHFKNLTPYENDKEILIIIKKIKEKVLDNTYINMNQNIENIFNNNTQLDGVIKLKNLTLSNSNNFNEYLNNFENYIDSLYIKNNIFFEYKNIIDNKNLFLKRSIKEGVRFECITC